MNNVFLSNILARIAPSNDGFAIYGTVNNESEYSTGVVFNTLSEKPSWSAVQDGMDDEQWVAVRASRDQRLQFSDWTVLPDVPLTIEKKAEWETYRQELRDITDQPDPFNINWPTPPE